MYLKEGVKAYVKGKDIGKSLMNMIDHTGAATVDQVLITCIVSWKK
jgi:hypothetical protein